MFIDSSDKLLSVLPAFVIEDGQLVPRDQIGEDWVRWGQHGIHRAQPIAREAYTTYETTWGYPNDDLIRQESVVQQTHDQAAEDGARAMEISRTLADLDAQAIRPTRAILTAQVAGNEPAAEDVARLAEIEAQAQLLRTELAGLPTV